jgi:SAM-dependent MidA family methyltransferase
VTETTTILRQELEAQRVISFARFMHLALYCPNSGYYEQTERRIGRTGDFFTSVSVGPLFGRLLAFQFAHWLEALGAREVTEAGAHNGQLAADILGWLRQARPRLFEQLRYHIIEPSASRRDWQQTKLADFAGHVEWVEDLPRLPARSWNGVMFANELLDAFPVHRLAWDAGGQRWREWGLAWERDQHVWCFMPEDAPASWAEELAPAGLEVPPELRAVLPDGFLVELAPTARQWWRDAAVSLHRGKLLTFDYGLTAEERLLPERAQGTLRAYRGHRVASDLLAAPGEQDLTAHVNFTQLQAAGEAAGLRTEGFVGQAQFLTEVAREFWREAPPTQHEVRQFQTLTHPEHLGRAFRVLIQSRG